MTASRRSQVRPFAVMDILERAKAGQADGVLNLCVGEPSQGAPSPVLAAAAAALHGDLGYTEPLGLPRLRAAVAAHYERRYGVSVDPARVVITTGSSGGFLLTFLAAFDAGDRVALARPGYPAYANILASLGCDVVDLPCGPATRYQPVPAMLDAQEPPVAGLVVAGPANPTGTMVAPHELAALGAWCADRGARLISDEIYHGIVYPGPDGALPPTPTAAALPGAVVVSSWSKYWGMTGWRLGWLVLPDELVARVAALAGNYQLCAPTLAQHAALAAFDPQSYAEADERVASYAVTRAALLAALPRLGWSRVAPADGAFYLYADVSSSGLDAVTYCRRALDEARVALTPGLDFDPVGGGDWVRLCFAVGDDVVEQAVDRLVAWQKGLPGRP